MIDDIPFEKIFRKILKNGGSFADLYQESTDTCSVILDDNKIEDVSLGTDAGVGLRAISDLKVSFAHGNCRSDQELLDLASRLADAVQNPSLGLIADRYQPVSSKRHVAQLSPNTVDVAKKVAIVREANKAARDVDTRVQQVRVVYGDKSQRLLVANAEGLHVIEERTYTVFTVQVVAGQKGLIQTGYEPVGGLMGFELFEEVDPADTGAIAARRAVRALDSREAPGGLMPAILSSQAGGTMIHEAVGHGLEGDLAFEGLSVYSNRIGETVASPLITVVDDATLPQKRGSYGFDDEGIKAQKTVLIESGVLKEYLCDRLYAMKCDTDSTGNGRRQSYKSPPVVRMSNTLILPGKEDPKAILRNTPKGVLVVKMGGGQVNTVNGDFVFEVSEGYLINNGEIGDPIRGATLTGNGPEILMSIDRVGNDLGFGIGTCGKDGQGVPVSDAQPTIRIPEIVVGGTAES